MNTADPEISSTAVCVARQPILDRGGRVYGYELLYRAKTDAIDCTASGDLAAARTLSAANQPRQVLDAVVAYEQAQWDEAALGIERLGLPVSTLPEVYADALRWARAMSKTAQSA